MWIVGYKPSNTKMDTSLCRALMMTMMLVIVSHCPTALAEEPPCNSILGVFTVDMLRNLTQEIVYTDVMNGNSNASQAELALDVYLQGIQYDLLASKVCGSCADLQDTLDASDPDGEWLEYCGPDVYGYEATHSGVVFHPLDPSTGKPLTGVRNAIVSVRGAGGLDLAYSTSLGQYFDANMASNTEYSFAFNPFLGAALGASSGLIGISFDHMGTGASTDYGRYYLTDMPVRQAAVVNWYAAREYTQSATLGCTDLGSKALTLGFSWGGAAIIFASLALEQQGVSIERSFSHAGVYSNVLILQSVFGSALSGRDLSSGLADDVAFVLAAYSNEAPFLPNTGTGQTLMSPSWLASNDTSQDVLGWIFDEKIDRAEASERFPKNATIVSSALNPAMFGPIASAGSTSTLCQSPHATAEITALCGALFLNEPSSVLDQVSYPLQWCHSPEDATVPLVFSELFLVALGKPNIYQYDPVYDFLAPRGGHVQGGLMCAAGVPTYLARNDSILEVTPIMTDSSGQVCPDQSVEASSVPTSTLASPSLSPSLSPTTAATEESAGFPISKCFYSLVAGMVALMLTLSM